MNKKNIILSFFAIFFASLLFFSGNAEVNAAETDQKSVFYENADSKLTNYLSQTNALASSITSNNTTEKKIINNVVVFIKFKGQADIYAERGGYQNIMNQIRGLDEYIKDISEDQVEVNSVFCQLDSSNNIICYEDIQPKEYFMEYSETNPIGYEGTGFLAYLHRKTELLNRISDYLGNDFLKYIDDENREYSFTLVVPERGKWAELLWSHQGEIEILGKRAKYAFVTVSNSDDIRGGLRHEFLHTLGFPDLYRYKNVAATVGQWSIMGCANGYPTVYERFKYGGWIQNSNAIKEITKDGQYALSPACLGQQNAIAYKIPVPGTTSEYFMIEYRGASVAKYENNVSEGLIVYRVNNEKNGNSEGPPDEVYVLANQGQSIFDAYLDGTVGRNSFSNFTLYNNVQNLGINIFDIKKLDGKIYFNISMTSNDKVTAPTNITINQTDNNNIELKWTHSNNLREYYKVYRNGQFIGTTKDNSYTDKFNTEPLKTYSYQIKSFSSEFGQSNDSLTGSIVAQNMLTIDSVTFDKDYLIVGDSINIKINARGGVGQLQYKAYYWMPWGDIVLQDYSPNSNINWKSYSSTNWTMFIIVKDEAGNTKEFYKDVDICDPLKIDTFNVDKESPQKFGTRIKLSADTKYTGSGNQQQLYKFYYKLNGNKVEIQRSGKESQSYFTPEKPGNYILGVEVTDLITKEVATKEIEYKVTGELQTTIYYSGYSNPYIHYKVGNGSWTAAPGVKIGSSNEVPGYPYKVTINLGESENLTACFNNGSGSWDSNGGKNYSFGVGYYTYSNGKITKIDEPKKELAIDSLTSSLGNKFVQYDETIFNTEVSNNSGDVQYSYSYVNNITGELGTLRDFSSSKSLACSTLRPGIYTITVDAKDSQKMVSKSINIEVTKYKELQIDSVASTLGSTFTAGKMTTLSINTSGGKGPNYYTLSINGKEILSNSLSNSVSWTPTEAGTYTIGTKVTDQAGKTVESRADYVIAEKPVSKVATIYYKGYSNPYIHYRIGTGAWTSVPGVKMTATSEKAGYTHKITIDLGDSDSLTACFNNGSGTWDSNGGANYSFGVGNFTYEGGKITPITIDNKLAVESITADKVSPQKIGTMITLGAKAINYKTSYGTNFIVRKNGVVTQNCYSDFNSSSACWIPSEAGVYTITAEVQDAEGNIATKTIDYTITNSQLIVTDFSCYNNSYNCVGGMIEFRVQASSDVGGVLYTVTATKDGKTETVMNPSSSDRIIWSPKEAGKYVLTVKAVDAAGNIATKSMDFTVPDETQNQITVYYNGYANPYIHYKIGTGAWTSVPGIKMTATSEKAGYTHKITIDLGDAENLTACFNNGLGTWDSNNGSNYYFSSVGTYTYSNSKIAKIQ